MSAKYLCMSVKAQMKAKLLRWMNSLKQHITIFIMHRLNLNTIECFFLFPSINPSIICICISCYCVFYLEFSFQYILLLLLEGIILAFLSFFFSKFEKCVVWLLTLTYFIPKMERYAFYKGSYRNNGAENL